MSGCSFSFTSVLFLALFRFIIVIVFVCVIFYLCRNVLSVLFCLVLFWLFWFGFDCFYILIYCFIVAPQNFMYNSMEYIYTSIKLDL